MDKSEFPTLNETIEKPNSIESSWANIVKPNEKVDNEILPNVSYANVAGHEKKLSEEFPTLQESHPEVPIEEHEIDITPPNPDRSFADVTSNKGYPKPEKDNHPIESLSDLPDVKDMLNQPSIHIPPVPTHMSFAKIVAKEIPPEKRPLSERAKSIISEQENQIEDPLLMSEENFPTLGQSNLMAQENADNEIDRSIYSEISRFQQVELNEEKKKEIKSDKLSFATITSTNLENAPPSAQSHVDQHPVYNEEIVYLENTKRENRKQLNLEFGNNNQLINEEELKEIESNKKDKEIIENIKKSSSKDKEIIETKLNEPIKEDESKEIFKLFDQKGTGRITIFQTITALYKLGYSIFTIIPSALFMHLRLSPMTSPYQFPFIYRSPFDLILLPIYTKNLNSALTYKTPMLYPTKEKAKTLVKKFGHKEGLGYWDGIKVLNETEKSNLKWYQFGLWVTHRIQWTIAFTMLHEPKSNVVPLPTLVSLSTTN